MSDKTELTTSTSTDQVESKSDSVLPPSFNDLNTSTPARLFGQFKTNGFGFNNSKDDEKSSSSGYFTASLSKFSSSSGFGSSTSTPLAASLASLGTNKTLFGGSSSTTLSSFTDLKPSVIKIDEKEKKSDENEKKTNEEEEEEEDKSSLLENVAEYEAKRASTHPTVTIEGDTSTGEENEITKFQMAGKLFMYNGEQQQFVERGYGILKINESHDPTDWDRLQARLIMRLDKSFRVILNSPIFPKMTVERATDRSVRFGAQDESQLRVFIIKSSTIDCTNLCRELQSRIEIIERQQPILNESLNTTTTSSSSDQSPNTSGNARKRSHSQSDSDVSDKTNDLSKKSKTQSNQSTHEDESVQ